MNINEQARLSINLELETLQQQERLTPAQHRRKVALLVWLGELKDLIDHVEKKQ
ncbi:hypothetical protein [Endozoicomonas sp. GU-1]|uniref:hypothetical protein n=1 Tax=Endozoicomonas sp. GU-1 TaxID=3009078 RepID=UPI0022B512C6|nr:hypothetical protein [Endozoicomonas sp. GU-1]WBA86502.1 hypothetical protein O3276_00125 [Endozoicomonas sp. GU-1]